MLKKYCPSHIAIYVNYFDRLAEALIYNITAASHSSDYIQLDKFIHVETQGMQKPKDSTDCKPSVVFYPHFQNSSILNEFVILDLPPLFFLTTLSALFAFCFQSRANTREEN